MSRLPGVRETRVDFERSEMTVAFDAARVSEEEILGALSGAGYPATRR